MFILFNLQNNIYLFVSFLMMFSCLRKHILISKCCGSINHFKTNKETKKKHILFVNWFNRLSITFAMCHFYNKQKTVNEMCQNNWVMKSLSFSTAADCWKVCLSSLCPWAPAVQQPPDTGLWQLPSCPLDHWLPSLCRLWPVDHLWSTPEIYMASRLSMINTWNIHGQ